MLSVIFRITGGKFARPINRQAQGFHLCAHGCDVVIGPFFGMPTYSHRSIFSWHAKGVPPHWMQHIMSGGQLIARNHIAHGVIAYMAHVNAARWVGKHFQDIVFRTIGSRHGFEGLGFGPSLLPFGFDFGGGIAAHGICLVYIFMGQTQIERPPVVIGCFVSGFQSSEGSMPKNHPPKTKRRPLGAAFCNFDFNRLRMRKTARRSYLLCSLLHQLRRRNHRCRCHLRKMPRAMHRRRGHSSDPPMYLYHRHLHR